MNAYISCIARVVMALSLVGLTGQAMAVPTLTKVQPTFFQPAGSNGQLSAGLVVAAKTSLPVLAVGGGFTISCGTSSLTQTSERLQTVVNSLGASYTLSVPQVIPSTYTIPNWSSIPAGTCGGVGQCVMQYKGQARDEGSEVSIGLLGTGVNFQLIPAGEVSISDPIFISVCRWGQPQCCTPGCQLP